MNTITLRKAKELATDSSYLDSDDIGRIAIIHTDYYGSRELVDLAAHGETESQALEAYKQRVGVDEDNDEVGSLNCAVITK